MAILQWVWGTRMWFYDITSWSYVKLDDPIVDRPPLPNKISAATSSWAPSSLLAVQKIRSSSVIGSRSGSVPTLWQISLN